MRFETRGVTVVVSEDLATEANRLGVDLRSLIAGVIDRVDSELRLPSARVSISLGRGQPATGLGGDTDPFTGNVTITVDRDSPIGLEVSLERWLRVPLAHELNHVKRIKDGPGFGASIPLGDAFVFEGLAEAFAAELYPGTVPPWLNSLTPAKERQVWARAKPRLREVFTREELIPWFQGGDGLPRWVAYTVGYHIVRSYLRNHPGVTAASLVTKPASKILERSAYRP